ncbi:MAG: NADH-quinone oxidoreductase subunit C [Gammaproteobacteria bacterium]
MTAQTKLDTLDGALTSVLGDLVAARKQARGELTIEVTPGNLVEAMTRLKNDPALAFTQLSDLAGVDYLSFGVSDWQTQSASSGGFSRGVARGAVDAAAAERRFAVSYQLLSVEHNVRLRVKTYPAGEPPRVASVTSIWSGADWFEREAFDLFGILFEGHPDLRRILTDYGFIGHPFRKDFPLEGYVEVRYDPEKGRVINQPVSIEPRTLVPRVIREEDWLHSSQAVEPEPQDDAADA